MQLQRSVFVSSLLAAIATTATAGDCDTLKQIMAQAPTQFVVYKGAYEKQANDSKYYKASVTLAALPSCRFIESTLTKLNSVACSQGTEQDRRQVELAVADQLVKSCGFRILKTHEVKLGKITMRGYDIATDGRPPIQIMTTTLPSQFGNNVTLTVHTP